MDGGAKVSQGGWSSSSAKQEVRSQFKLFATPTTSPPIRSTMSSHTLDSIAVKLSQDVKDNLDVYRATFASLNVDVAFCGQYGAKLTDGFASADDVEKLLRYLTIQAAPSVVFADPEDNTTNLTAFTIAHIKCLLADGPDIIDGGLGALLLQQILKIAATLGLEDTAAPSQDQIRLSLMLVHEWYSPADPALKANFCRAYHCRTAAPAAYMVARGPSPFNLTTSAFSAAVGAFVKPTSVQLAPPAVQAALPAAEVPMGGPVGGSSKSPPKVLLFAPLIVPDVQLVDSPLPPTSHGAGVGIQDPPSPVIPRGSTSQAHVGSRVAVQQAGETRLKGSFGKVISAFRAECRASASEVGLRTLRKALFERGSSTGVARDEVVTVRNHLTSLKNSLNGVQEEVETLTLRIRSILAGLDADHKKVEGARVVVRTDHKRKLSELSAAKDATTDSILLYKAAVKEEAACKRLKKD